MDNIENTTPNQPYSSGGGSPSGMPQNTKSKSGTKRLVVLLVALILLVGAAIGGFVWGQYDKNKAVETAWNEAKADAEQKHQQEQQGGNNNNQRPAHEQAPPKTSTDPTCNADELKLTTGEADGGGAAGTDYYAVVLENIGSRTCHLGGFPGVSLVNDNGNMIGNPADRVTGQQEAVVQLAPGAKAQSVIGMPNSENFDDGQCKTGATKLRVYPPNDTGYLSVAATVTTWCPGFSVAPVTAVQ